MSQPPTQLGDRSDASAEALPAEQAAGLPDWPPKAASSVQLDGPRVRVRTLEPGDLDRMDAWQPSDDPLHALWGVPHSTPLSRGIWFAVYMGDPTRLWYTVVRRADGAVMGSISLRDIVRPTTSRLGVTFGSEYVDQGYGTEALRLLLPHYFGSLGFQEMVLDVAAPNARAVHVYEKLGFQYTGSHYRDVADDIDLSFLQQAKYKPLQRFFRHPFLSRSQILFYDMALERSAWEERTSTPST